MIHQNKLYSLPLPLQDNDFGKLGRDSTVDVGSQGTDMSKLTYIAFAPSLGALGVTDVAAGSADHACAIFDSGNCIKKKKRKKKKIYDKIART